MTFRKHGAWAKRSRYRRSRYQRCLDKRCRCIQWLCRAALASIALAGLSSAFMVPAYAQEDAASDTVQDIGTLEAQLKNAAERLKQLDEQLKNNRARKSVLEETVNNVSGKVAEREARLAQLSREISRYNGSLEELEAQVAAERARLDQRKEILASSLRRQQQITRGAGLRVVLQHTDPSMSSRLGTYTDFFINAQNAQIAQQLAIIEKVEQAHATALKDRNWLNHIQRKASSQHQAYVDARNAVSKEIVTVDEGIEATTRTVAELKADTTRLQTLMEELKQQQVANSGYFASGRGTYTLPTQGSIFARFNEVKSVGKVRWQGIFIAAKTGNPVRSVADGEVVYSDFLQGFGQLVIVDHGDSYMTLYGGNRETLVRVGDWVDSGRPVATVGNTSGQRQSGLYFEIRHDAKPMNPEEWLTASSGLASASK